MQEPAGKVYSLQSCGLCAARLRQGNTHLLTQQPECTSRAFFDIPAVRMGGFFYDSDKRGGDVPREDGYKNLVPLDQRTKDEQRTIQEKGGIASGVARRRKRSMREAADYYLALPETDRRSVNALLRDAVGPEDIDNQMAVIKGITARAKKGDPQAANVLLKMLGEDNPPDDTAADTLERARELLGGVDSAID